MILDGSDERRYPVLYHDGYPARGYPPATKDFQRTSPSFWQLQFYRDIFHHIHTTWREKHCT